MQVAALGGAGARALERGATCVTGEGASPKRHAPGCGKCRAQAESRDQKQLLRAQRDAKHKMALIFRWYLGQSSRWARLGEKNRKRDFQIWSGPAMGAFNEWAANGPFQDLAGRNIVAIADALWDDMLSVLQGR